LFLLDANVLIYAFRRDSPHHAPCHEWLGAALAGGQPVATTSLVELALLRISTLPSLGSAAATPGDVFRFLDAVRAQPVALRIEPGERHPRLFAALCEALRLRGNDVNDAFLAALAIEYDATLVSADRGFARFPGLKVVDPLADTSPAGTEP
jgi:toxin-antitoxin system PIN domain toxin